MSRKQRPNDLGDFLIGLFAVSSMVFAIACVVALAVASS